MIKETDIRMNLFEICQAHFNKYLTPSQFQTLSILVGLLNRYKIEAMFKDCKSGGYNLEGTKANTTRLTNIMSVNSDRLYKQSIKRRDS